MGDRGGDIAAAMEVASLLRGGGAPQRLFILSEAWMPARLAPDDRDPESRRRFQLLWLQEHCVKEWLPKLAAIILAQQPVPGGPRPAAPGPISVPDAAEAFGVLCRFVQTGFHRSDLPALAGALQAGLVAPCDTWLERTRQALEAANEPDMAALAVGVLRVEAVLWILSLTGMSGATSLEPKLSRLVREAIRAADRTLKAFLADPTLFTLFDAVTVMSRVDDLLTLLARLTEQREQDGGPSALSIDAGVQGEFLGTLESVSRQLCGRLRAWLRNDDLSARLFGSVVQQLCCIHRLACGLDQPAILRHVEGTLLELLGMADQVIRAERAAGHWKADASLLVHTDQLADLAEQIGRGEIAVLLRRLRQAA